MDGWIVLLVVVVALFVVLALHQRQPRKMPSNSIA